MSTESETPAPQRAVRFVFAYDGDDVRLVSRQEIAALAPPTDRLDTAGGGFFAELRDSGGALLYRRVIPPIPRDVEVFDETPDRTMSRVPVEHPTGVFTVLVPQEPDADHLALLDTTGPSAGLEAAGAREVVRVPLREPEGGSA
jgi:hypothetical protein